MKTARIYELAEYLPPNNAYFGPVLSATAFHEGTGRHKVSRRPEQVEKFLKYYKVLDFGWGFVQAMIDIDFPLPDILEPDEDPLERLYYHELGVSTHDPALSHAVALGHSHLHYQASVIQGLLLVRGATCASVAKHVGVPEDVIRCYEMLFFNVLDRKGEGLILSEYLYPAGRIGAAFEDADRMDFDLAVKRSGYNNNAEDVSWTSGMVTEVFDEPNGNRAAKELEARIMTNGLYLARNGFINNREKLADARGLLAAAKQGGGQDAHVPDEDLSNMSDSLSDHLMMFSDDQFKEFSDARRGLPTRDSVFVAPQTQLHKGDPDKSGDAEKK